MTREEAIHELQEDKRLYETEVCHAGDGSPDGRLLEAIDMAIEALSAEADGANLINRHDAITVIREECWKCNNMINDDLFMRIMSLPTSRQTDCTEFIMWLVEVVLDDEDWELNAVAYGEIIARKLKKLGFLEVKDGYYIRHIENNANESDLVYRPSAEAEWIPREHFDVLKKNYDMLAGLLEEAKARAIGAWIPCSERLPDKNGWYLVTVQGYGTLTDVSLYSADGSAWGDVSAKQKVIAWMPLPKPYKDGN